MENPSFTFFPRSGSEVPASLKSRWRVFTSCLQVMSPHAHALLSSVQPALEETDLQTCVSWAGSVLPAFPIWHAELLQLWEKPAFPSGGSKSKNKPGLSLCGNQVSLPRYIHLEIWIKKNEKKTTVTNRDWTCQGKQLAVSWHRKSIIHLGIKISLGTNCSC